MTDGQCFTDDKRGLTVSVSTCRGLTVHVTITVCLREPDIVLIVFQDTSAFLCLRREMTLFYVDPDGCCVWCRRSCSSLQELTSNFHIQKEENCAQETKTLKHLKRKNVPHKRSAHKGTISCHINILFIEKCLTGHSDFDTLTPTSVLKPFSQSLC